MAKSRRANRRANRKSRRAERKSRKASRKNRRSTRRSGGGLFGKIYSPVSHLLMATENAVGTVTGTVNTVAKSGLRGVNRIGKSVTGHANAAVRNLVSRKRKNRRAGRR
jgi:hypothetical protein